MKLPFTVFVYVGVKPGDYTGEFRRREYVNAYGSPDAAEKALKDRIQALYPDKWQVHSRTPAGGCSIVGKGRMNEFILGEVKVNA